MNILALTSVYPQPDDGSEVVTPTVQYFCQKWVEAGHNVIVIHNNSSFPCFFYWIPDNLRQKLSSRKGHNFPVVASRKPLSRNDMGVKVYRLPMVKVIPHGKFSKRIIYKQVAKIEKVLKENSFQPEMIISHWVNPQVDLVRLLKKKYDVRTSLVFHNDCNEKNIKKFDLESLSSTFDVIGCRSESYANYVKKRLQLSRKPFICYSGIPDEQAKAQEDLLENASKLVNNKEFLYVGRLVAYKNVDTIINALAKVYPKKNFKLHIVGVGAEREKLEDLISKLGLKDNVVFHGQIDRKQVFELMKNCFCFTMVSNHETFGMVYIEAMLAGCITIASKNGGVDGVIIDGKNGYLSREGDIDDLAKLYRKIEEADETTIKELRMKAIETALQFKDSEIAKKYLENVMI